MRELRIESSKVDEIQEKMSKSAIDNSCQEVNIEGTTNAIDTNMLLEATIVKVASVKDNMDDDEIVYFTRINTDIYQWLVERFEKDENLSFKLQDVKEKFLQLSPSVIEKACTILEEEGKIVKHDSGTGRNRIPLYVVDLEQVKLLLKSKVKIIPAAKRSKFQ